MPSTASTLATVLFAVGLLAPILLLIAGVVFALVTRSKSESSDIREQAAVDVQR